MKKIIVIFFGLIILASACKKTSEQELKFKPMEDLVISKHFPEFVPNYEAMERALFSAKEKLKSGSRTTGSWELQGPTNIGARINSIAIHPINENIIFAGFSDGGLWKTSDGGKNWASVFDNEIVQSIGDITFDPINTNIVYVGTGDVNISGYVRTGGGLYKSKDLGNTWEYIGLKETNIISKVIVLKSNPNTIYVSSMGKPFTRNSDKGVHKSTDGGKTWDKILFINDSTGISDMVINPANENIIYAIGWNRIRTNKKSLVSGPDAKVWRSKNGGASWEELTNGLPTGSHTRLGIAISESNPNVLYVQYTSAIGFELEAIYKTEDGGDSWSEHSKIGENGINDGPMGGFGWYFGKLAIDPINENELYMLGVGLHHYNSDINVWEVIDYSNDGLWIHSDKHDLVIRGENLYLATDGGLFKTKTFNFSGNWEDIDDIPTNQFYRTAYDPHRPSTYWGGAQDNGTCSGSKNIINNWNRVFGGDGFQMAFHADDANIMFAETQNGNIVASDDGGINFRGITSGLSGSKHWDMQYILSHHNPNTIYTGTDKIFRAKDALNADWEELSPYLPNPNVISLSKQVTTLDESSIDEQILYAGTNDGMVWNTLDGGQNWNQITNGVPLRYVSSIKASPSKRNSVFVTFTGYRDNDNNSHIYKSTDNGNNWKDIAGDLPAFAINDVVIYPDGSDLILFAATDAGVYVTKNGGKNWDRLGNNMPIVPVFDMDLDPQNNDLIAATFGRSLQTFDLNQVGINIETASNEIIKSKLEIYPSITSDFVNIKNNKENKPVLIFDVNGKQIDKQYGNKIDVSKFSKGIYIINAGIKSGKIFVI